MTPEPPEDLGFRSLAAPGLDEDDLYAAMVVRPGEILWGEGRPSAFGHDPESAPPSADEERRRRHREMLTRWEVIDRPTAGQGLRGWKTGPGQTGTRPA